MELNNFPQGHIVHSLAKLVNNAGGQCYVVGGCVRDLLMGRSTTDWDLEVFGLTPEQLTSAVLSNYPFDPVGKSFGIYKLRNLPVDIALPRRERKTSAGHRGFDVEVDPHMSPADAAMRRDFTINSIYLNPLNGTVFDPAGGLPDLKALVLRHTSTCFAEDPLRVLRAMQLTSRFELLVASETIDLCSSMTPEGLAGERYLAEWFKWLTQGSQPSRGLRFLRDCNWIRYFPELAALIDCPQSPAWHPEGDVWNHTLHCLDAFASRLTGNVEEDWIVGLAVLCHDLGKPAVTVFENGHWRSPGHEAAGVEPTTQLLERMRVPRKILQQVIPLVRTHMRPAYLFQHQCKPATVLRLARDAERIDRLLRLFRADEGGRPPLPARADEVVRWIESCAAHTNVLKNQPKPILTGKDLIAIGWTPGPHMGKMLKLIYEAQLDGSFNSHDEAIHWLNEHSRNNTIHPHQ